MLVSPFEKISSSTSTSSIGLTPSELRQAENRKRLGKKRLGHTWMLVCGKASTDPRIQGGKNSTGGCLPLNVPGPCLEPNLLSPAEPLQKVLPIGSGQ